jgi:type IV pilus assembly protein PilO/type IV pilus assembly protein PilQ
MVNNKLKRQTYQARLRGGFESTQAVVRDLERLQPLVIVRGLRSQAETQENVGTLVGTSPSSAQVIPIKDLPITTDLQLDVIIPLTAEEVAKLAPPPPPPEANQEQKK